MSAPLCVFEFPTFSPKASVACGAVEPTERPAFVSILPPTLVIVIAFYYAKNRI